MVGRKESCTRSFVLRISLVHIVAICACLLPACTNCPPQSLEPQDMSPSWAPDSDRVAFVCYRRQASTEWDADTPYLGPYSGLDSHTLLEICISDVDGSNRRQLTDNMIADSNPAWSPVGDQIAFVSRQSASDGADIYVMATDGSNLVNLTNHPAGYANLRWAPQGDNIAFISTRDGGSGDLYVVPANGGHAKRLTQTRHVLDFMWSPDGDSIAFESGVDSTLEIHIVDVAKGSIVQVTNNQVADFGPCWSPDGRQIVFSSVREIGTQVYIVDLQTGEEIRISEGPSPASLASWSPDGRSIAYVNGGRGMPDQVLRILGLTTGEVTVFPDFQSLDRITWSPNSKYLIHERLEDWNKDGFKETKLWILQVDTGARWALSSTNTD
jgi:Tol biopolymer transport system component